MVIVVVVKSFYGPLNIDKNGRDYLHLSTADVILSQMDGWDGSKGVVVIFQA